MVIESIGQVFYPSDEFCKGSHISSLEEYQRMYKKSIEDPELFWTDIAKQFYWKNWSKDILSFNFDISRGPVFVKWMDSALTNMCYNVVDRVVSKGLGDRIAYYWYRME